MPGSDPQVPPDGPYRPYLSPSAASFAQRLANITQESRLMWDWAPAVEPDEPESDALPEPEPEPEITAPARDPFPREHAYIMPTPNRRGPGRVARLTRYPEWLRIQQEVATWGRPNNPSPQQSEEYVAPRAHYGHGSRYSWFFLGWHSNGMPMFAVKFPENGLRLMESDIRQAIRELISDRVRTAECHFCWSRHPMSTQFPVPASRVSVVEHANGGNVGVCSACSRYWVKCAEPGCLRYGDQGSFRQVITDLDGTIGYRCYSHLGRVIGCGHCELWMGSIAIRDAHNCVGSDQDWNTCSICSRSSRTWMRVTLSDGRPAVICRPSEGRCGAQVRQCALCSQWDRYTYPMANTSTVAPGARICTPCATLNGVEDCEHCNNWFAESDTHDCHSDGGCRCERCRTGRVIHSYSFKPRARFKGHDRHGLFLGMELEIFMARGDDVEARGAAVDAELGRTGYLKYDGSISHGFEMVTHPMSYTWAMKHFPWHVLSEMEEAGAFATNGSGIHVHASRAGFVGPKHEYSWMIFMHRNAAQFKILARRDSSQWASFDNAQRKDAKLIATKKKNDTRRYRAINQTNTATIEIRIFKSSLSIQTVQATLGLVHASIEYTRTLRARDAIKDKGWTWSAFVAWVRKQGIYGPLVAEMERLDVLDDTVTPGRVAADPESDYESDCDCGGNNDCNGNCSCDECDGACYEPDDDY